MSDKSNIEVRFFFVLTSESLIFALFLSALLIHYFGA